jgi:hypothetical protein
MNNFSFVLRTSNPPCVARDGHGYDTDQVGQCRGAVGGEAGAAGDQVLGYGMLLP